MKEGGWWQVAEHAARVVNRRGGGGRCGGGGRQMYQPFQYFHMAKISDMAKIICVTFQFQLFKKVP
jgi:hypothetical protein